MRSPAKETGGVKKIVLKKPRLFMAISFFSYLCDLRIKRGFVFFPEITRDDNSNYKKSKKEAKKACQGGGERQKRS